MIESGYDKASTNCIAEQAGISIGSLYHYFPNKEALITALRDRHLNEMMTLIESKLQEHFDQPIDVVVPEIVKASLTAHAINPTLHKVLHEQVPRMSGTQPENEMNQQLRAYLAHQINPIDAEMLDSIVFMLERAIESLTHAAVIDQPDLLQNGRLEHEISQMLLLYLNVTVAQGKGVVAPDTVADNLSRKSVAFVGIGRAGRHETSTQNLLLVISSPQVDSIVA